MNYRLKPLRPFGVLIEAKHTGIPIGEISIADLSLLFSQNQLVLLRGFATFASSLDFSTYCQGFGELSLWPFGAVLELIEQDNPTDHIFDNSYVPLHWDGMYRKEIPEYQIFHCVSAPLATQGGRTTFSHTPLALKQTSAETKKLWEQVTGIYQRKMEFYHSKTVSPIINKHPYHDFSVLRYNEPPEESASDFVNPPLLEFTGLEMEKLDIFHRSLKQALYNPSNFYAHEWQQGDVVIADNFTLLHGREAFVSQSPRHLQRVHVLSNPSFANPGLEFIHE